MLERIPNFSLEFAIEINAKSFNSKTLQIETNSVGKQAEKNLTHVITIEKAATEIVGASCCSFNSRIDKFRGTFSQTRDVLNSFSGFSHDGHHRLTVVRRLTS